MTDVFNRFSAFDVDAVAALHQAFDQACLRVDPQPASEEVRELIARKITELAQNGLREPDALCERTLSYFNTTPA